MASGGVVGEGRKADEPRPQDRSVANDDYDDDERQRLRREENRGGWCESLRGYRSDIACVVACVLALVAVVVVAVTCSQFTCVASSSAADANQTLATVAGTTKFLGP